MGKNWMFLLLEDHHGATQVVLSSHGPVPSWPLESVVEVSGTVRLRPPDQVNRVALSQT
jgi:aspartyl-tRNA synthetase